MTGGNWAIGLSSANLYNQSMVIGLKEFTGLAHSVTKTRTVLAPLIGILALHLVALVIVAAFAPQWLVVAVAGMTVLVLLVCLSMYVYFAFKNPDALRTEEHQLRMSAIEKGIEIGDSNWGMVLSEQYGNAQERSLPQLADSGVSE